VSEDQKATTILVVHDVEETRDGIEKLLKGYGYVVSCARDDDDAVARAKAVRPDLILINLGSTVPNVIALARRIRQRAGLGDAVPIVLFCVDGVHEGGEMDVGHDVYLVRPDNFEQLENFVRRRLQTGAG
jgi:CheY-like chemotaxis protein